MAETDKCVIGYTVGVFDKLHYGHKNLLIEALQRCSMLVVGIHTDKFTASYKRIPSESQDVRISNVVSFLSNLPSQPNFTAVLVDDNHMRIIKEYGVTEIYHGSDWDIESYKAQIGYYKNGMADLVSIIYIDYTIGISTTKILNNEITSLTNKKCIVFDLDNTLILNGQPMKFVHDVMDKLNRLNKDIYIVSNNNRYTVDEIQIALQRCNIRIVDPSHIITPLDQIVKYLRSMSYNKIAVWCTESVRSFFTGAGFDVTDITNTTDVAVDIVVILYKNDYDYDGLCKLCSAISKYPYIVSNIDRTYPDAELVLPDTGSVWKLVEYCTTKQPVACFGKPNRAMLDDVLKQYDARNIVFIGDSDVTDKVLALNCGIDFIRVHPEGDISHLGVLCDFF